MVGQTLKNFDDLCFWPFREVLIVKTLVASGEKPAYKEPSSKTKDNAVNVGFQQINIHVLFSLMWKNRNCLGKVPTTNDAYFCSYCKRGGGSKPKLESKIFKTLPKHRKTQQICYSQHFMNLVRPENLHWTTAKRLQ